MTDRTPIIAPDTPKWVRRFVGFDRVSPGNVVTSLAAIGLLIAAVSLLVAAPVVGKVGGGLLLALLLGGLFAAATQAARYTVGQGDWLYRKQPIVGQARTLLDAAVTHSKEAEEFVRTIPTRLDWRQFRPHVEALLWDAAGHAAEVCQLNEQINKLKYAEEGTPQGAVHADLWRRRQEHLAVVAAASDEMLALARAAGNAAAAAQVALARSGSVHDLEVVSPSAHTLIAQGGLTEAHDQLRILADAWTEVDATAAAVAEVEDVSRRGRRGLRARRSQPPIDQQQEG